MLKLKYESIIKTIEKKKKKWKVNQTPRPQPHTDLKIAYNHPTLKHITYAKKMTKLLVVLYIIIAHL